MMSDKPGTIFAEFVIPAGYPMDTFRFGIGDGCVRITPKHCQYCGSKFIEDKRGNCSACGAPWVESAEQPHELCLRADEMKRDIETARLNWDAFMQELRALNK